VAATAIVDNCNLSGVGIVLYSQSTFNITFTNNVLKNNAALSLNGAGSNHSFVDTIISNNSVVDGPREFVVHSGVAGWKLASIGNYEYRNNIGTEKPDESIKLALRIPWYSYGATIPSGKKRYLQQTAADSNVCSLHGVTINDLFFSFGENTKNDILVRTDPKYIPSPSSNLFCDFTSLGVLQNSGTYANLYGAYASALYRKGQSVAKGILNNSYAYDYIYVFHSDVSDGELLDIVLIVDKVYYANATGEILK
jgi:hypothetical protein